MDMRTEPLQVLWEAIAEIERARLRVDADQAQRLERIARRLIGVLDRHLSGKSDCQIRKQETLKGRSRPTPAIQPESLDGNYVLERDAENSYLAAEGLEVGPMDQLLGFIEIT
jgi:hypothetical protein